MNEKIYLNEGDVRVTNLRINLRGPTYFTNNISGVAVGMDINMPAYFALIIPAVWGILGFAGGGYLHVIGALLLLAALLKWLPFRLYYLALDTNSGRVQALRGRKDYLLELKDTIETAITEKDHHP